MTGVLGREALEAVAIVAVTTAAFAAGRGDDRSGYAPRGRRRPASPLAVMLALGTVAIVAAVAVVVAFGGARHSAVPTAAVVHAGPGTGGRPSAQPTRSRSSARPSSPAQFAQQ